MDFRRIFDICNMSKTTITMGRKADLQKRKPQRLKDQIIYTKTLSHMYIFYNFFMRSQSETFSITLPTHYEMYSTGLRQEFSENFITVKHRNNTR